MEILLHICCGPCLIYPFKVLKDKFKVKGFYYNPNIYPLEEYNRRKDALGILEKHFELKISYPDYRADEYFEIITAGKSDQVSKRCELCYNLRLKKTAQYAKNNGFKLFSTTLLVSPYQDHEKLINCARIAAKEAGIEFYYEDFRPGFRQAQKEAKAMGIYRQKYCGCKFSAIEDLKKNE